MSTTMRLLPVRVSADLRGLIDQVGPVNPATRALLLLGADAAGLELRGLEREIAGLLAAELEDGVRAALRQLLTRTPVEVESSETRHNSTASMIVQPEEREAEETTDPFAGIGIDV